MNISVANVYPTSEKLRRDFGKNGGKKKPSEFDKVLDEAKERLGDPFRMPSFLENAKRREADGSD